MNQISAIWLDEYQHFPQPEKIQNLKAAVDAGATEKPGDFTIRLEATYKGKNWGTLKTGCQCIIFPRINNNLKIEVGNRNLKSRQYDSNEEFLSDFGDLKPYQGCPNAAAFLTRFNS